MAVRNYANGAVPQPLTAAVSDAAVTIPVASTAGYPTAPFVVVFERGTANVEAALCTAKTANSFTVTRGFDGTTAVAHDIGTSVEHCSVAIDYVEANAHANTSHLLPTIMDAAGDFIIASAADVPARFATTATADRAMVSDPTAGQKVRWADVGLGVWLPYTPTWGALSSGTTVVGNGYLGGRYRVVGKTCDFYFTLSIGSTSYGAFGPWYFTHPPGCTAYQTANLYQWCQAYINKTDAAMQANGSIYPTYMLILCPDHSPQQISNSYVQSGSGWPTAWGPGDHLRVWGTMEIT